MSKISGMYKILEWKGASPKDEAIAQHISKKINLGSSYFRYNVPLQIHIFFNVFEKPRSGINMSTSYILNYMPRKSECRIQKLDELFVRKPSNKDIKDFLHVSAVILKHLSKQFGKLDPLGDVGCVYYPNCSDC